MRWRASCVWLVAAPLLWISAKAMAASEHARPGFVLEVQAGGNKAMGGGSSGLDLGLRLAGTAGYELKIGSMGLAPQLLVSYDRWGVQGLDASQSCLGLMVGAKLSFYLGRFAPWVAVHGGFGRVSAQIVSADVSRNGYGLNAGFGLDVFVTRILAVGAALAITKVVVDEVPGGQVGSQGFSFGANIKLKL